jgi:hypothetical protein
VKATLCRSELVREAVYLRAQSHRLANKLAPTGIAFATLNKKTGRPHAKGTACKNNEVFGVTLQPITWQ